MHINDLLQDMVESRATDLHLKVGQRPVFRVDGNLKFIDRYPPLTAQDTEEFARQVLSEKQEESLRERYEIDTAYGVPGLARFRVNIFHQRGKIGIAFRLIPLRPWTLEEIGAPEIFKELCLLPRGFILVTGPTGSGKSTTLAAMIDYINHKKACHIITVEDPIEYIHHDNLSTIEQREIGIDTHSFARALKYALRQDPDVILAGELRDLETISAAITAAETGRLVFATLHTPDAAQAVDRMIDVFPPYQQEQIRIQLSGSLQAVIAQTLLTRREREGRVAAFEVLLATEGVRNIIREGKTHQLYSVMQTSSEKGMQTLDQDILRLYKEGKILFAEAVAKTSDPQRFELMARGAS